MPQSVGDHTRGSADAAGHFGGVSVQAEESLLRLEDAVHQAASRVSSGRVRGLEAEHCRAEVEDANLVRQETEDALDRGAIAGADGIEADGAGERVDGVERRPFAAGMQPKGND